MAEICDKCGANLALVGVAHRCNTLVANEVANDLGVANTPRRVANNKHGQYADKGKRREYMREYMRKKRTFGKLLKGGPERG